MSNLGIVYNFSKVYKQVLLKEQKNIVEKYVKCLMFKCSVIYLFVVFVAATVT